MREFCDTFGININWLKHGEDEPFLSDLKICLHPLEYYELIKEYDPQEIYFVQNCSEEAETCIILRICVQ